MCKIFIIVDELLDSNETHNFIGEIVESASNEDNKRKRLSHFLVENLNAVSLEIALVKLLCIYSALPTTMKLFIHLGRSTVETCEEAFDILGRLKNLIDYQREQQNDETMEIKISCLQRIWLKNTHELYHALATQSNKS